MPREPFDLHAKRRLLFAGLGAKDVYALDPVTGRVLAFDPTWQVRTCTSLPLDGEVRSIELVGERPDGPCFLLGSPTGYVLYLPGAEPVRAPVVISPLEGAEERPWIACDAGTMYRISDGEHLGPAPLPGGHWKALPGGLVDASKGGPITLLRFDQAGGDGAGTVETEVEGLASVLAHADSLFVRLFGGTVVELAASTLAERGRQSFLPDHTDLAHPLRATDGVLFVETSETLFILARIGDQPRAVARNLHPQAVVTWKGHWMCLNLPNLDDMSAYVSRGADVKPNFVRFDMPHGTPHACADGVLFVRDEHVYEGFPTHMHWTFLPWELLLGATSDAAVRSAELTLPAACSLKAKVLLAGATILRLALVDDEDLAGMTATVPSGGNPLGLAVGDIVRVEGRIEDGKLAVERVLRSEESESADEDVMTALPARTVLRSENGPPPAWVAVLVRRGLVGNEAEVSPYLWRGSPVAALRLIYSAREGIVRGFVHYDHRVYRDTEDPAADLAQIAGVPDLGVSAKLDSDDDETIVLREPGRKPKRLDLDDGLGRVVRAVSEALARRGAPREIYECEAAPDAYAFVACTSDEANELRAAGVVFVSRTP